MDQWRGYLLAFGSHGSSIPRLRVWVHVGVCGLVSVTPKTDQSLIIDVTPKTDQPITRHGATYIPTYIIQGGYSDLYVPFCGLAIIEELSGVRAYQFVFKYGNNQSYTGIVTGHAFVMIFLLPCAPYAPSRLRSP